MRYSAEDLIVNLHMLIANLGKGGGLISPSVYDTAQTLRFYPPASELKPALDWLIGQQRADGGWGDPSMPQTRDAPTLASILALYLILYGEDIPPASIYLDFSKPVVSPDLLPPYLIGVLHCYWSQQPGYSLDQEQLRTILYDFAYVRPTWQVDKTGRAEQVLAQRKVWEQRRIIGLGKRVGPFWYPD